ncbi:MAG TPA: transposase [Tepidisphaeraceae bacterium]|jgi:putative transposase|nr:transposase [Tepidisphaeraceae bacterium]
MDLPPRKTMRRRDVPGTARFLTFSCYRRLPLFSNGRIKDRLVAHLGAATLRHEVRLIAWVVMPDHLHLIVCQPSGQPLTPFLQALKRPLAAEVFARWRALNAPILSKLQAPDGRRAHFWQPGGGYDRNVLGVELIEKIAYVHRNPIRRGLTTDSVSWVWSSARAYADQDEPGHPPIAFDLVPRGDRSLF